MKKVTLIASIAAVLLLSTTTKAQTIVSAKCQKVTLNSKQIALLHSYKNAAVDSALKHSITIKNNSTADFILAILDSKKKRKDTLYIAGTN